MSPSDSFKVAQDVAQLMELNRQSFEAEENGQADVLMPLLTEDFRIIRSDHSVSDKAAMRAAVPGNANKGRAVDEVSVKVYGDSAVVGSHLTTTSAQGEVKQFWNTKVFVRQDGQWRCRTWQVARIS